MTSSDSAVEPNDMLMTAAPFLAAYSTARAIATLSPMPDEVNALSGMISQFGHAPAMPMALLVSAAAMPAQWVPWP